jgi:hypothetical protein
MKFPLHHGRKPQRGAATIELIIVLPFLLLLLVGSTDYARVMHTAVSLDSAVRVGVLTGVYILNQPDGYTKDADGNITVSGDVYEAMQVAAVTEALPHTIPAPVAAASCRCPEYDQSEPDSSDLGLCTDGLIQDCEEPEIHLAMTATTQVDLTLQGWALPVGPVTIERTAIMAAR